MGSDHEHLLPFKSQNGCMKGIAVHSIETVFPMQVGMWSHPWSEPDPIMSTGKDPMYHN